MKPYEKVTDTEICKKSLCGCKKIKLPAVTMFWSKWKTWFTHIWKISYLW